MRITVSSGRVPAGISEITAFSPKYASPQPTAEAAAASTKLSTSSCRISRPRVAPSVTRIAISRSRAVARASNKLATLLQAISSKRKTAASNAYSVVLKLPMRLSTSVWATTVNFSGNRPRGSAFCRWCAIASSSAPAASALTPGLRRPIRWPSASSALMGIQRLAPKALKCTGMMPTRIRGVPRKIKRFPRIFGSPPNSRCQSR